MPGQPIPGDWNGLDWCCQLIEWPASQDWQAILLGLLTMPTRGRFWDEETGTITDAQAIGGEIEARNCVFDQEGTVNCLDEIVGALRSISGAIVSSSCCQATGPGYVEDGEGGFWYGTEAPVEKPASFGGEGEFETEAAFEEHLCAAANNIVSGLILTLNSWSVLSLAGLVAGALIVAFFVTAPPLALFLVLAGAGFTFGTMSTIATYIDTNRQEWVCAIFSASGYADMLASVDQLIDDLTVSLDLGLFVVPLTDIIHATLSTDVFNRAYSVVGLPAPIDPIDCSACQVDECINNISLSIGTLTDVEDNGDGTYWLTIDTDYIAGEDHEKFVLEVIDADGPYFSWLAYEAVAGAPLAQIGYTRIDNTTGTDSSAPFPAAARYGLRAMTGIASGANSPNSATVWRFKVTCALEA